jgi:hypothetical protein
MILDRATRWTGWVGLLSSLAAAALSVFIVVMLAMGVCFRAAELGPLREVHFYRAVHLLSNPSLLGQTVAILLPLPVLTAALGGLGIVLTKREASHSDKLSVAVLAVRYGRVGWTVGGAVSTLILASVTVLIVLRWCLWG